MFGMDFKLKECLQIDHVDIWVSIGSSKPLPKGVVMPTLKFTTDIKNPDLLNGNVKLSQKDLNNTYCLTLKFKNINEFYSKHSVATKIIVSCLSIAVIYWNWIS